MFTVGKFRNHRGIRAKGRAQSNTQFWEDVCNAYRIHSLKSKDKTGGRMRHLETDEHSYRGGGSGLGGIKATTFEL